MSRWMQEDDVETDDGSDATQKIHNDSLADLLRRDLRIDDFD